MDGPVLLPEGAVGHLQRIHRDPPRRYHTWGHACRVARMVEVLAREEQQDPTLSWLAALFHDAVYDTRRQDNEERSAELALALGPTWVDADWERVAEAIRWTSRHGEHPEHPVDQLLMDADLEILGAIPASYQRYVRQIRREFKWVPDAAWARARGAFLERMLVQPSLFVTASARDRWEHRARQNLQRELDALSV